MTREQWLDLALRLKVGASVDTALGAMLPGFTGSESDLIEHEVRFYHYLQGDPQRVGGLLRAQIGMFACSAWTRQTWRRRLIIEAFKDRNADQILGEITGNHTSLSCQLQCEAGFSPSETEDFLESDESTRRYLIRRLT